MSTENLDDIDLDSNIGKNFLFHAPGEDDKIFSFSSTIEDIGKRWDKRIKNKTVVMVLSEPVELDTWKYGKICVVKILTKETMWVPKNTLFEIKR